MHFSCAVITKEGENAEELFEAATVTMPFDLDDDLGDEPLGQPSVFWDWYVVGGRWAEAFSGKSTFTVKEALENYELSQTTKAELKGFLPWHKMIFACVNYGELFEEIEPEEWKEILEYHMAIGNEDGLIVIIDYHN